MINLIEKLKDCPEGTRLYSPVFGDVEFVKINEKDLDYPIVVTVDDDNQYREEEFTAEGKWVDFKSSECVLFPSKDNRDWNEFNLSANTLKPFDKVLCRRYKGDKWECDHFSHYSKDTLQPYCCISGQYRYCIPYEGNEHLLNTTKQSKDN